jgi:proton glutamate symport protein
MTHPPPRTLSPHLTLLAVATGALLGLYLPSVAEWIPSSIGALFLRLLKLVTGPLILFSCLRAVLTLGDLERLRRVGGRAAFYYITTSALAAATGATLSLWLIDEARYAPSAAVSAAPPVEGGRWIEKLVPGDLISPLLNGEVLQLVTLALALSLLILARPAEEREGYLRAITRLDDLTTDAARAALRLTPLAALCISADLTRTLEWTTLSPFGGFLWAWGGATLTHACVSLPLILWIAGGARPLPFALAVKDALLVALTTASSAATLPASKRALEERAGVSPETTSFVLPLGATLNMDGSAIYQAQLLIFMCAAEGRALTPSLVLTIIALVLLSSAGTAAIPRGGIAMMGMMITTLQLPPVYLGLYIAIDQVLDYPITAVNVWGDLVGAKILDARTPQPQGGR